MTLSGHIRGLRNLATIKHWPSLLLPGRIAEEKSPRRTKCPISNVGEPQSSAREGAIGNQVRLGDLLIRAKLITEEDVQRALACQRECGGRLGDNLVAIGAISQQDLNAFVYKMPAGPPDIASTGLETTELISLLMKLIYTERL